MTRPWQAPDAAHAPPAAYASYAVRPAERPAGRLPDRKETEVRRMLDAPHPPAPPDLADRAMAQGRRLLHRRRVLYTVLWLLVAAAVVAAAVGAALYWHSPQPLGVTPPMRGL